MKKFISLIADRMIFASTRDPIDPEGRTRQPIPFSRGQFEAWVFAPDSANPALPQEGAAIADELFALKFPGTGGRAERGGPHPCEAIAEQYEVWTINPPGYGSSDGKPSLKHLVETCEQSWHSFSKRAGDRKKIVVGNSLGCISALYVAARFPVAGVLLRNPVPLNEFILERYSWWNLGIATRRVVNLIPPEMNVLDNARDCRAPALFVSSQLDRLIPVAYQQKVFERYGGEFRVFEAAGIDHDEPIRESQTEEYLEALNHFGNRVDRYSARLES